MSGPDTLCAALVAYDAGLAVLPPIGPNDRGRDPKKPLYDRLNDEFTWKHRQRLRSTPDEIRRWYTEGRTALGVVCGALSGNLELFDFDCRDTYDEYKRTAHALGYSDLIRRVEAGYCEDTPGGGVHWFLRCPEIAGNTALARRPGPDGKPQVLIETRGEGGFAVVAPTVGLHENGKGYILRSGSFATITTLTLEDRRTLFDLARTFDQLDAARVKDSPEARDRPRGQGFSQWVERPGDDFNRRATWNDVLQTAGWEPVHTRGSLAYWRRPDKDGPGWSATTGIRPGGLDLLHVFTTSSVLRAGENYSKFTAYALLHHGGDFQAAAKELQVRGYGTSRPKAEGSVDGQSVTGASASSRSNDADADDPPIQRRPWPTPPSEAVYHGLAGEIVRAVRDFTESDPLAILVQVLIFFGNMIGRSAWMRVEATHHYCNENVLIVGWSSVGRKGTSADRAREPVKFADNDWVRNRFISGLSSGEGLIYNVRDASYKLEKGASSTPSESWPTRAYPISA
jgi:hypothetical protein